MMNLDINRDPFDELPGFASALPAAFPPALEHIEQRVRSALGALDQNWVFGVSVDTVTAQRRCFDTVDTFAIVPPDTAIAFRRAGHVPDPIWWKQGSVKNVVAALNKLSFPGAES